MKKMFYSAMIGASALAFSAGAMAENAPTADSYTQTPQAATTAPATAPAPEAAPTEATQLSRAEITDTQRALQEEGYAVSVDGVWGPSTAEALAAFQHQNELPVTGQPDDQTLAALEVKPEANR